MDDSVYTYFVVRKLLNKQGKQIQNIQGDESFMFVFEAIHASVMWPIAPLLNCFRLETSKEIKVRLLWTSLVEIQFDSVNQTTLCFSWTCVIAIGWKTDVWDISFS